jgi:hypothetical protein
MKLSELISLLERHYKLSGDQEVVIPVHITGSIGTRPSVPVNNINVGFDWDKGYLFLEPSEKLRKISSDEIAAEREKQDKLGWALYENRNLKTKVKDLKKKLYSE